MVDGSCKLRVGDKPHLSYTQSLLQVLSAYWLQLLLEVLLPLGYEAGGC